MSKKEKVQRDGKRKIERSEEIIREKDRERYRE
jgi:hypothetical protein